MKTVTLIAIIFTIPWLINIYKLVGCDFKSDYKCEAVHALGVFVGPASLITVWFDDDRKDGEK